MDENNIYAAKCSSCGADMVFNPETQTLKCPHCGTEKELPANYNVRELDIFEGLELKWDDSINVTRCQNCGAEVLFQKNEVSKSCPYCGAAHVVEVNKEPGLKPNCVFPFTLTKNQAVENVKKWIKKKFFAPRNFKKNFVEDKVYGVYEPGFTFDSMTYSSYNGVLGKRVSKTVTERDSEGHIHTHTETEIKWFSVSGKINCFFDDVLVNGSKNLTQNYFTSLAPYNYETLVNYDAKYLAGFSASMTEKTVKNGFSEAKIIIDKRIREKILNKYDCDEVRYLHVNTSHEKVTYKYVFFPIYHLIYSFKSKKNNKIYINGNTGKVSGKVPVSGWKVFGIILVVVVALILLAIYFTYKN